jgi:hypothetical protein
MTLPYRKLMYSILALGSFYLALLAVINLWYGLVVLPISLNEGILRIAASALGLFGFICAWVAIISLPVRSRRNRFVLAIGILGGFCSAIIVFALEGPVASSALSLWRLVAFSYVFGGTALTGVALIVELMLGPNSSIRKLLSTAATPGSCL